MFQLKNHNFPAAKVNLNREDIGCLKLRCQCQWRQWPLFLGVLMGISRKRDTLICYVNISIFFDYGRYSGISWDHHGIYKLNNGKYVR